MNQQDVQTWASQNDVMVNHFLKTRDWFEFDVCCTGHAIHLRAYLDHHDVDYGYNGIHFFIRNSPREGIQWEIVEAEFQKAGFFTHPIEGGLEVCSPDHDVWDDEVRSVLSIMNMLAFIQVAAVEGNAGHIFCRLGAI